MKDQKHTNDFTSVGSLINHLLRSLRSNYDDDLTKIWDLWNEVLEERVSQSARPEAVKGNLLLVRVFSSPMLQELQFMKKDIIFRLNRGIGRPVLSDIRFKIGS